MYIPIWDVNIWNSDSGQDGGRVIPVLTQFTSVAPPRVPYDTSGLTTQHATALILRNHVTHYDSRQLLRNSCLVHSVFFRSGTAILPEVDPVYSLKMSNFNDFVCYKMRSIFLSQPSF